MRPHIRKNRRLKRSFRAAAAFIGEIANRPFVKLSALILAAMCLLLFAAPCALTKLFPDKTAPESKPVPKADFATVDVPGSVTIFRTEKEKTETLPFEDYIKGVVSGEMPSEFHEEALKAQAVAARTYSLARVIRAKSEGNPKEHPDAPLCDSTHCQVYRSPSELEKLKGTKWMKTGWKKICSAVDDTKGQLLYYNGQLVEQALFHSSSGGRTENSEDVFASAIPYLVSVDSPYEKNATHRKEKNSFTIDDFSSAVKSKYPDVDFGTVNAANIEILSRSSGNRVWKMKIGNATLEGRQVREALGLPSANFTIDISGGVITFTSDGSGHGVGMSQYGADGMAERGYDYRDILSHYYSGTKVY